MSILSDAMERLLIAAAELRAAGNSWETVAARLGRSVRTCHRWLVRYRVDWEALYEFAERDQAREGGAESTAVLRKQLREEDAKGKRDAAKALLTSADRVRRGAKAKAGGRRRKKHSSLTDDDLRELHAAATAATARAKAHR